MELGMKRLLCLVSIIVLLLVLPASRAAASVGDVDGDGTIDGYDAVLILRHDVGLITLEGPALTNADTSNDGEVDGYDAVLILRCDVGLISCEFGELVEGTVTDGSTPVPGAVVRLYNNNYSATTTTDENGYYSFSNVPPGTYFIVVSREGFVDQTKTVTVN